MPHPVGRVAAIFAPKLTADCNVNVLNLGGEIAAFTETTLPMRFAPETLATLGVYGYDAELRRRCPRHMPITTPRGRQYSYIVDFGLHSLYRLFSVRDAGAQHWWRSCPSSCLPVCTSRHDRALSGARPVPACGERARAEILRAPLHRELPRKPERGLRFHAVEETGREVSTASADAVFAFHHVNVFEDGDDLVIDMIAYPDAAIIEQLYLARLRAGTPITATGILTRFRVPLDTAPVTHQTLAPTALELPRINYDACAGKPYRHVWGTGIEVAGTSAISSSIRYRDPPGHELD